MSYLHASDLLKIAALLLVLLSAFPARAQTINTSDHRLNLLEQAATAISQGNLAKAEALLNSVLAGAGKDADAFSLLGIVRAQQQKPDDAERLFRRAIAAAPDHIGAHVNLSELLLALNRAPEALEQLRAAHKLAPERAEINLNLATLYADTGEYPQALSHLQLIPRPALTEDYFTVLLRTLLGLNQRDEVHRLAREFGGFQGRTPEGQAEFGLVLAKSGFSEEALDLLESARRQTNRSFPLLYALGVINAGLKRYDKATEDLTAALEARPDDITTLRALANVARATGNLEKSLAHLVQARRIAPESPAVLYDFGVTTLKMDLLLDALPVFEQLYRSYPDRPAYLFGLAAVRWRKGETLETAQLMKKYVSFKPEDPAGFYLLGAALLRMNNFTDSRAALKKSISLKPDADAEYLLGVTFESEGDRGRAIETFERVIRSRPDHAAAHAALGVQYREAGNYSEARIALERAYELDPSDLRANYQLGLVYAKLGEQEKAKQMLARAEELRAKQRNEESVILKLIEPPQN